MTPPKQTAAQSWTKQLRDKVLEHYGIEREQSLPFWEGVAIIKNIEKHEALANWSRRTTLEEPAIKAAVEALKRISQAPSWPAKTVSGRDVHHTYAEATVAPARKALAALTALLEGKE